ncbi:MAG: M48 family metallopeptidase [Candidatus Bathyarchaeia archaeon]
MQKTEPQENYQYDTTKRSIAKRYENVKLILDSVNSTLLPIAFCVILFFSGDSVLLSRLLTSVTDSYWISLWLYLVVFIIILQLLAMPISFYSGFIVDHKFSLSTQTLQGWVVDELKGLGVELGFGVLAASVLYYLIGNLSLWWIAAAAIFAVFSILLSIILPFVILPIFYKVNPLSDMNLKENLLQMSKKFGGRNVDRVLVADESRRSIRANAFFSGVGKSRSIVLFDTLLSNFTHREIITVVAHELGHYVNKDIWKEALTSGLLIIPPFYIADYALRSAVTTSSLPSITDPAGIPLIFAVLIGISFILQPISNWLSRIVERNADEFALKAAEDSEAQASAERRLADLSLSVDSPSRLVELLFYTHPPSSKRVQLAENWKKTKSTS